MPYYPQPNQGFLAPLIGAAVQYFSMKDQMQNEAQRRALEEQQMKIASQEAATQQQLAPSEIELAQAKADQARMEAQPFPGFPGSLKNEPTDPTMPGYSPSETLQRRADDVHKYMAGVSGVKTFWQKRLDFLSGLPQTPSVLGEISAAEVHLKDSTSEVDRMETELDRIQTERQRASDRRDEESQRAQDRASLAIALKHIPQARISISTGDRGAGWSRASADPDTVDMAESQISKSDNPQATAAGLAATALEHGAHPRTIDAIRALGVKYGLKYSRYHPTKYGQTQQPGF